jgi:trehalose-phosphatase
MQALRTGIYLADFWRRLARAMRRVLMLDYDGTLAPFRVDPETARPYQGVPELLDRIMAADHTQVVVVSGRWTRDLVPLLGLKTRPELWGSSGWELLRPNGEYETAPISEPALRSLLVADDWIEEIEAKGGRCERKPASLAIHWRGLTNEQAADIREVILANWRLEGLHESLVWHDFDGGIELRAPGRSKGDVVREVLRDVDAACVAAYLGDDQTDEDAFRAMTGRGVSLLVRPQYRPSAADFWIRPPGELLAFLAEWHRVCAGGAWACSSVP